MGESQQVMASLNISQQPKPDHCRPLSAFGHLETSISVAIKLISCPISLQYILIGLSDRSSVHVAQWPIDRLSPFAMGHGEHARAHGHEEMMVMMECTAGDDKVQVVAEDGSRKHLVRRFSQRPRDSHIILLKSLKSNCESKNTKSIE